VVHVVHDASEAAEDASNAQPEGMAAIACAWAEEAHLRRHVEEAERTLVGVLLAEDEGAWPLRTWILLEGGDEVVDLVQVVVCKLWKL